MEVLNHEVMPKEFLEDANWGYENYSEWMKKYPDMWVAIVNKEIVAVAEGPETTREIAKRKTGKTHIPVIFVERNIHVY